MIFSNYPSYLIITNWAYRLSLISLSKHSKQNTKKCLNRNSVFAFLARVLIEQQQMNNWDISLLLLLLIIIIVVFTIVIAHCRRHSFVVCCWEIFAEFRIIFIPWHVFRINWYAQALCFCTGIYSGYRGECNGLHGGHQGDEKVSGKVQ